MRNALKHLGIFFALLAIFITLPASHARSIRSVEADDGSVIVIRTALGYSTILEFSSKPLSAVLGDQDAFRLEYVGNSITIKPLLPRAKSNLFVFTEYDRFNCELHTVSPDQVDYIVRVRAKEISYPVEKVTSASISPPAPPCCERITARINRSTTYDGFKLTVRQLTRDPDASDPRSATIIEFELASSRKTYAFQSASLGVQQGGKFVTPESLYLEALEIAPSLPTVHGKIALLSQDFDRSKPILIVFAVPSPRSPQKPHLIEVSTAPPKIRNKTTKKGGEPWEQDQPKAPPQASPASPPISSPSPTPSVSGGPFELDAWPSSPSFL